MNTIILYRPQIPQNAGNIVRTCHATGSDLVLVRPLGFKTDDKSLKRAGLDYWEGVDVTLIDDLMDYLENETRPFYFFSSKATSIYTETSFENDVVLIFGSESAGLPDKFINRWPERFLTLPMQGGSRCLNLSNSAAIALYEALRQNDFISLKT
ncbi:MAG: tRNA (cytidine(34)-2'-O)-methyltransferase [Chlamydiales bacterium]|nr:tRNA (cytidine(34)-2'-O)-methyltransferase [Chlamydiia bacterium]MCP5503857.1 tRNA (cytidine(34)-2'-O)-methyltransferase [Chlamydiales bacterium]